MEKKRSLDCFIPISLTRMNGILQVLHLALLFHQNDAIVGGIVDSHAGRVIAAVFQSLQASDEEFQDLLPAFRRQIVQIRKDSYE